MASAFVAATTFEQRLIVVLNAEQCRERHEFLDKRRNDKSLSSGRNRTLGMC